LEVGIPFQVFFQWLDPKIPKVGSDYTPKPGFFTQRLPAFAQVVCTPLIKINKREAWADVQNIFEMHFTHRLRTVQ
jgi:hypothetical protein